VSALIEKALHQASGLCSVESPCLPLMYSFLDGNIPTVMDSTFWSCFDHEKYIFLCVISNMSVYI